MKYRKNMTAANMIINIGYGGHKKYMQDSFD
jgi:hypothetical protein